MATQQIVTFQEALEVIESLPEHQQEDLINLIKKRLSEIRRQQLADNIREASEEYARGEVKEGTIDNLMRELPK